FAALRMTAFLGVTAHLRDENKSQAIQPFAQLDGNTPRVSEGRGCNAEGMPRIRAVQFHSACFELLAELLQVFYLESDVVEHAAFGGWLSVGDAEYIQLSAG